MGFSERKTQKMEEKQILIKLNIVSSKKQD